jgi:hypothetical protein
MPTNPQLKRIWAAAREVGLEEADLRDLVERCSGQRSISALTTEQAIPVIDALVRLGASAPANATGRRRASRPSGTRKPEGVTQLMTPGQATLIDTLRSELGGDWARDEYFAGAVNKRLGKSRPATAGEAAQVIEMLKGRRSYNRRAAR